MVFTDTNSLEKTHELIEKLWDKAQLTPDQYFQAICSIAARYLKEAGELEKALILINSIPAVYFKNFIEIQMQKEPQFADEMVEFATALMLTGLMSDNYNPTQGTADA